MGLRACLCVRECLLRHHSGQGVFIFRLQLPSQWKHQVKAALCGFLTLAVQYMKGPRISLPLCAFPHTLLSAIFGPVGT